jgi:hypothetical protein
LQTSGVRMDFWAQYSNELARAGAWGTILALLAVGLYFVGRWYISYRKKHAIIAAKENASAVKDAVLEKGKQAVDVTLTRQKVLQTKQSPSLIRGSRKREPQRRSRRSVLNAGAASAK